MVFRFLLYLFEFDSLDRNKMDDDDLVIVAAFLYSEDLIDEQEFV